MVGPACVRSDMLRFYSRLLTIYSVKAFYFLLAIPLAAQPVFTVTETVKQGELIHIETTASGKLHAVLGKTTIPLFPDGKGGLEGLLPVAVTDRIGLVEVTIGSEEDRILHTAKVRVINGNYPIQNISASTGMKQLTPLPGEMEAMRALYTAVTPEKKFRTPFQLPVSECRNSLFGVLRYHNGKPSGNFHRGLDLRSPMGTPVGFAVGLGACGGGAGAGKPPAPGEPGA